MLPGATETLTFEATIPALGTQVNTVDASIVDQFAQTADASDTSQLVAFATADVTVVKSSDPVAGSTVRAGDQVTYTLSYRNDGTLPGVVDSTDDLSAVLDDATLTQEPLSSSPDVTVTRSGDSMRVTGPIDAGGTVTVTYRVTVKPDGQRGDGVVGNVVVPDDPGMCRSASDCEVILTIATATGTVASGLAGTGLETTGVLLVGAIAIASGLLAAGAAYRRRRRNEG